MPADRPLLFISGFHRSGTTMVTTAVTAATGAATLTAGDLARHLPRLDRFLRNAKERARDRGVDRLAVTEATPEEYGWLLRHATGEYTFGAEAAESGILHRLVDELTERSGAKTVVLKNPWDTGREAFLLDNFPDARILLVRRDIGAIEDSLERAWDRYASSSGYVRALIGDPRVAAGLLGALMTPERRAEAVRQQRRRLRMNALRLAQSVGRLPLDRVAFLSYDELRRDPRAGAAWAAHVLDPDAFARAVTETAFQEYHRDGARPWQVRAIDWYWERVWRRVRARQVAAGLLPKAGPLPEDRDGRTG